MKEKKILLFIGSIPKTAFEYLLESKIFPQEKFELRILKEKGQEITNEYEDFIDFSSENEIKEYFSTHAKKFFSVTARGEKNIPLYQKVIPFLPKHIYSPSIESLSISTDKFLMRKAIQKHNKKLNPKYLVLKEYKEEDLDKIIKKIQFPLIIKPTGLASSMLVSAAYNKKELETGLKKTFKKIKSQYKKLKGRGEAKVLIEEFIEGDVFSVDVHINNHGEIFYNPFVRYTTAMQKGFDDFYIYEQHCPANISKSSIEEAKKVVEESIKILKLKNVTAHVELIRNEHGWKLVEVGPRAGGYRNVFYKKTFNSFLDENDLIVKTSKKLISKRKKIGYISVLKFTAKKEGYLRKISGIQKMQKLESYLKHNQRFIKDEKILFAKNGGKEVLTVTLYNTNKQQFISDKRELEKMVNIETERKK